MVRELQRGSVNVTFTHQASAPLQPTSPEKCILEDGGPPERKKNINCVVGNGLGK